MKKVIGIAVAATLAAGAAWGQVSTVDPAKVPAGVYTLETQHTRILFSVPHMGFTTYYGDFTGASGRLQVDGKAPALSRVTVSIPVNSVSTTNATLDKELKGADWFDTAKFPTIAFRATKATVTGRDTGTVTGDLTLHGVTRPVTLQVKFNGAGVNPLDKKYTVGFEASGHIRRSEFGVKKYVPLVGDDVKLTISAAFERAG